VQIDIEGPFPVQKGDRFLLCSDGLSGQVTDEEMGAILSCLPVRDAAQLFVDLSNLRGGPDNITAVVVEVADERIATASQESIALRRHAVRRGFSPALGVVTAVCLSAALILFLLGLWPLALVATVLGTIALATGLSQIYWSNHPSPANNSRYGNGPYRQYKATPARPLFEHLVGTMKSLKEASEERNWSIDWAIIDQSFAEACKRADSHNYRDAIRIQSQVIIELMRQIRKQRSLNTGDSAIDL
jgi:protein phosphatase